MKKKKKNSIYVPNEELDISNWIPNWGKEMINSQTHSWFDFTEFKNPNHTQPEKYPVLAPIIPEDSYKQQLNTIRRRKLLKEPVFISCKKIRIYPDTEQQIILQSWFNSFAHMFNITIHYLRSQIKKNNIDFKLCSKIVNFQHIRSVLYPDKLEIYNNMTHDKIPIHILDEAIAQAVSNYKTCLSNLKSGLIKKFRIREWSKNRRRKIIKIEPNYFRNDTFCPSVFPYMSASESLNGIDKTVTLQYDSDSGKYILLVPVETPPKYILKEKSSCGIDLGIRSFITGYSDEGVITMCNDSKNSKQLQNYHRKIDKINELLQLEDKVQIITPIQKENRELIVHTKVKILKRNKLLKGLRKYNKKIRNMITDMHYKVSQELTNKYDEIYIGKLSTKNILSRNNKSLSKENKRMIGVLSPYMFRQRLKYMGHKYGCEVTEVNEYKTTKTCSNCGREKEMGKLKIYECRCGMIADRDENAAKNILKVGKEDSRK